MIGIQYEMRGAHVGGLREITAESENDDADSEEEHNDEAEVGVADSESARRGELRRQKIIARVEELRTTQRMTKQEFHTRIGASEARSWRSFVGSEASEAWKRVTLQTFEKIAHIFGIDSADLLK